MKSAWKKLTYVYSKQLGVFYIWSCCLALFAAQQDSSSGASDGGRSVAEYTAPAKYVRQYTRSDVAFTVSPPVVAPNEATDYVPKSWVIEAVRRMAEKRWMVFAIGNPIPCAGVDGALSCYQVPVILNTNAFPDLLTPPPASEISPSDLDSEELWGANAYWTFEVSAHKSDYPVFHYYAGLPPFLVLTHKAVESAKLHYKEPEMKIRRYYSLGRSGDWFEVTSAKGQRVFVSARGLDLHEVDMALDPFVQRDTTGPSKTKRQPTEDQQRMVQEYQRQAREAWEAIGAGLAKRRN